MSIVARIELLLHPTRLRIVHQFMPAGKRLTAHQVAEALSNVPTTTLYRHINLLVEGGILKVVEQHQIRGAVQRVYELIEGSTMLNTTEMVKISPQDHQKLFSTFMTSALADGEIALGELKDLDFARQGFSYWGTFLTMSEEEARQLLEELKAIVGAREENTPSAQRRFYRVTFALLPAASSPHAESSSEEDVPDSAI